MSKVLELVERVEKDLDNGNFWFTSDAIPLTKIIKLQHEALEQAYMSLADCASRLKAPEPYMLADIKQTLEETNRIAGGES